MKKINKNVINIIILAVIFITLFTYMIIVDGWQNILNIAVNIDILWIILGIACMIIYWVIEALIFGIICKKIYPDQTFKNSFKITMIGQLFNNITPFSSGGQPFQAISMVKDGKSASNSATILLMKFIIYQSIHVLYTLIILILKYSYFKETINNFVYLAIIGFAVNFIVIVALISVGINKKIAFIIIKPIYILLGKLHIMKNVEKNIEKLKISVEEFHEQFKIIKNEKIIILRCAILTIIQLTAFFTVSYTVYKSLGFNNAVYINMLSAQAFLTLIMAFVPIPGAGVVAEGGFYIIFANFFSKEVLKMSVLLWRLYTFYLPIVIGGIIAIFVKGRKNEKTMLI